MISPSSLPPEDKQGPRGIQSIEVGGQLLIALAHHGRPMALKDLARESGMAPAKAHPYLVSFIKLGLVEQETSSGRYGLGPLALQLGLISLQQYEPVRLATPRIEELAQQLGHTVAIAVWGNRGPTIVRVAEAPSPVHISMRHGTVMSLTGTASGRLFAAHLPAAMVQDALATEREIQGGHPSTAIDPHFNAQLAQVRAAGMAQSSDGVVQGVSALAAPVFDDQGRMVLSLTAIGPSGSFEVDLNGDTARRLLAAGLDLSRQLGWRQDPVR
ncbi:IclR family transcriptional regulator [Roseateles koreensis]|uniref:IclR family transcriptional regulator n=1 Tax=Roseateles koreensis TaxID=2987526 RepID=A0ABT5KMH7_9BURK|nr:IclR family transcriptional regulator [Roseateles koreensis]MDC8783578.1 IclR family transcriptional regulator [Roseateles koreensis]